MVKRVVLIIISAVLIVGGGVIAIAGGAIVAVFGSDSTLASGSHAVSTQTTALVAPIDNISDTNGAASTVGSPTLRLSVRGATNPVFIGVGPATAVDGYLAGAAVDTVTDLDVTPYRLRTSTRDGTARPAAPGDQTFWVASSSGASDASLRWKIRDGNYRLVLMNADAAPGVAVDGRVALRVPHLFPIGLGILIAGAVILLGGALVLGLALRRRRGGVPPTPQPGGGLPPPGQAVPPQGQPQRSEIDPAPVSEARDAGS